MTEKKDPLLLSGGPKNGQTYKSITRWPMYLDENGDKLSSIKGDRIMNGRSAVKGCYVLQRDHSSRASGYAWREVGQ